MQQKTFKVPNIGCDGCVRAIEGELNDINGVKSVKGEVETKVVTVEWDNPATWNQINDTLVEIDYAPEAATE